MEKRFEDFVNVSVRIRPTLINDEAASPCLQVINKEPPVLLVLDKSQTYHFDNIFTAEDTQKDIYDETVKSMVENVKIGYNCTVFAYGQTGTGKTYTMGTNPDVTNEDDFGLISRTLEDFFCQPIEDTETEISISFIEIYNEKVFDLLSDNKTPLSVKGFTVHGFDKVKVLNSYNALQLLKSGSKNRHTAGTKQNSKSSRSHAIFTIYCCVRNSETETVAKLNLVDLAGSESVRKTGNQGNSFHEGININKGLLSLGQVMTALSTNSTHIPYRQSIITTILRDSLNNKNFVSLIACVSSNSDDLGETLQTLEFSQRVKKMKNKPEINNFISQYKKDNPGLFLNSVSRGLTPRKRSNVNIYETPFKKPCNYLTTIQEPVNINFPNFDNSKSSLSSSISSVSSDMQQNLSPVIRKYMDAMEQSLMNKLETVIMNTIKRSRRTSSCSKVNKENSMTPRFEWEQLVKVVRSEVQHQFSTQTSRNRATSSPIESSSFSKTSPIDIEENVQILKPRKLLTYDNSDSSFEETKECNDQKDEIVFKVPAPISRNENKSSRRSSIRLQNKKRTSELPIENRRRSIRIQQKKDNDTSMQDSPKLVASCFCSKKPKTKSRDSPITSRTKRVLHILNKGTIKEIEKLHTIGPKTAEKIYFFRQLKGTFKSVSELSHMPNWTKNKYKKFIVENFLRDE